MAKKKAETVVDPENTEAIVDGVLTITEPEAPIEPTAEEPKGILLPSGNLLIQA